MLHRKSITWFLIIAVLISWPLFLAPLALGELEPLTQQLAITGLWALAMWGPGIAAIIVLLAFDRQPIKSLRLNTLGPKRFYLWAWLLPPLLVVLSGWLTIALGTGQLDLEFTFMQQQMEQTGTALPISIPLLVGIQIIQALILGPLINIIFTLGEEIGWRGFLLPRLMPLGQWPALIISGAFWGFWHAPAIAQGHNYPDHPIPGIFMMTIFTILMGIIIGWLYLNTRSPWVAALAHGALNAWAGLPYLFLTPGFDTALAGTLTSVPGWIAMAIFIGWLVLTKRLPVRAREDAE